MVRCVATLNDIGVADDDAKDACELGIKLGKGFVKSNPNHEPGGSPDGGQFSSGDGGGGGDSSGSGNDTSSHESISDQKISSNHAFTLKSYAGQNFRYANAIA